MNAKTASGLPDTEMPPEVPFFFSSKSETLLGVLSPSTTDPTGRPSANTSGSGSIIASGGWLGVPSGRNRALVRLAWKLAASGLTVLRFDYRGVGESTGSIDRFDLEQPFVDDLLAAVHEGRSLGIQRSYLVGFCFGALTALAAAPKLDEVEGLVLVSAPWLIRNEWTKDRGQARLADRATMSKAIKVLLAPGLLRDIFRPERRRWYAKILRAKSTRFMRFGRGRTSVDVADPRMSPDLLQLIQEAFRRDMRVLMVYGSSDASYDDFLRAKDGPLGELMERYASLVDVVLLQGDVHGLGRLRVQDAVIEAITTWVVHQASSDERKRDAERGGQAE
jgi:pimeloyl-ACP methyl ester carboxylesterase